MKKRRFGARPSELKQQDRNIVFGTSPGAGGAEPPRQAARRPSGAGTKSFPWKLFVLGVVLVIVGAGTGVLLSSDGALELKIDHIQCSTGNMVERVRPGDAITVKFSDGFICDRVVFKGLYRFLPPKDVGFVIDGAPQADGRFGENLLPLLQPEQQLEYRVAFNRGDALKLGAFSLSLAMTAADWIARADAVQEARVQVVCFEKAIALDPDSEDAHIALGRLYEGQKKNRKAAREYEAALKISPKNISALRSLVRLYEGRKGMTSRLLQLYDTLAASGASDADSLYFKAAELARGAGRLDDAMPFYRKALRQNRAHIAARQQLIKAYERQQQWKRAAANTQVLLEFEPKNADLRLYLSEMYLKMDKTGEALREAEHAARLKPGDAATYLQLALLAEKAKKYNDAVGYYKKALSLDKKNAVACNNLGMLLERRGNRKEAITYYKKAVELSPATVGYHVNLADAYEKNGQPKQAAVAYAQVVARDKRNRKAWEALAVLHERTQNSWKALEAYQALSGLEPKNIFWYEKMAQLYEQLGKLDKARDMHKAVLGIDPQNKRAKQKYRDLSIRLITQKKK